MRKPTCSGCGQHPPSAGQRYCKDCHAAYMRAWRRGRTLSPEQWKRSLTRAYTNVLIRRGHLVRGSCIWCDSARAEAHHPDYDRPRLVIWMCRTHHLGFHRWMTSQEPFAQPTK